MKIAVLLLAAAGATLFAGAAARADEAGLYAASLFFTPDEMTTFAAPREKAPVAAAAVPPADIHLGAVLYYGPDNWAVWLDSERWTPTTHHADMQIIEVQPQQVQLLLRSAPPDGQARMIALQPYQTWQGATGKVIEGMAH